MPSPSPSPADRAGLTAGLACYALWGVLPLLFIVVERSGAGPFETVAQRTLWSIPFAAALTLWAKQGPDLRGLGPRGVAMLALSATLIGVNWVVYVWAVQHGRTLEGSLGYYLNPLLNMAVGALVFRERMARTAWIAVALAAVGVAMQAWAVGAFPWVSLILAFSFCGYGVVRKLAAAPAQAGLLVECILLAAPALAYIAWLSAHGGGAFGVSPNATLLLIACGPATVVPLACFAFAAKRLPLITMGFLQFLAPTLQFVVGVANGEALTPLRLTSFVFVWAGVAVFALSAWQGARAARAVT